MRSLAEERGGRCPGSSGLFEMLRKEIGDNIQASSAVVGPCCHYCTVDDEAHSPAGRVRLTVKSDVRRLVN
jgi:hypothetical protein